MDALERQISAIVLKEIEQTGSLDFTRIDTATAVAEVITRTERELDSKAFFDSVPPSQRASAFISGSVSGS